MEQKQGVKVAENTENVWVCRKCGLTRSNKVQHIHGQKMPEKK